jgi:type VI protein secretion system component Hcp
MARIKIKDLPKDMKISKEELKRIKGGAFDSFLKIEGTPGESTDDKHKDWIEVLASPYPTR